jgi:type I restriction enzyme S subunit
MTASVPINWQVRTIGEVAIINPSRPTSLISLDPKTPVTFVPMAAVCEIQGRIVAGETRRLEEVNRGFTYFANDDVIFAKITPCMQNGKSAVASNLNSGLGFGSTEFHVLRATDDVIPEWLHLFVRRRAFRNEAKMNFRGSAGQQRVPAAFLSSHSIPVPPKEEQRRIVAAVGECFQRLDQISDLYEQALQEAIGAQASALASVFDSLRGSHPSMTIGSVTASSSYGTNAKCTATPQGVAVLRIPNVQQGHVDTADLKYAALSPQEIKKTELLKGDLLIVRTNGSPNLVGRCAVVEQGGTYSFASYLIRFRLELAKCLPQFLQFFLASTYGRDAIAAIRRTSAGQYNINSENIRSIEFPCPPVDVQNSVVEKMNAVVSNIHDLIDETATSRTRSEHLGESVLEKAFGGELSRRFSTLPNREASAP